MAKCRNCNIEILDETEYCPLCRSVLEPTDAVENMYPDARSTMRRRMFMSRLYLFCGLIAELILIFINFMCSSEIWWSALTGLGIIYGYLVLRYAIIGQSGYRSKTIVLSLIGILSVISADFIIGYRGWSVDYALPGVILLMDVGIGVCMIINHRNWQSYITLQLAAVLCSIVPIALNLFGLERNIYVAYSPFIASLLLFSGTVILGGRRSSTELRRRFHVD